MHMFIMHMQQFKAAANMKILFTFISNILCDCYHHHMKASGDKHMLAT